MIWWTEDGDDAHQTGADGGATTLNTGSTAETFSTEGSQTRVIGDPAMTTDELGSTISETFSTEQTSKNYGVLEAGTTTLYSYSRVVTESSTSSQSGPSPNYNSLTMSYEGTITGYVSMTSKVFAVPGGNVVSSSGATTLEGTVAAEEVGATTVIEVATTVSPFITTLTLTYSARPTTNTETQNITGGSTTGPAGGEATKSAETTTVLTCTRTLDVATTTNVETTRYTVSAGYPVTVTTTVEGFTTTQQTTESTYQGITTLASARWDRHANTIVQADDCHLLWVGEYHSIEGASQATDRFSSGTRFTLTPYALPTSQTNSATHSTATYANDSSESNTVSDGPKTSTTWSGSTEGGSGSTSAYGHGQTADGYLAFPVALSTADVTLSWTTTSKETIGVGCETYTTGAPGGPCTMRFEGPAIVSVTLVPPGTEDSSTASFSASSGETFSTTFSEGLGVATSACFARCAAALEWGSVFAPWAVYENQCFPGADSVVGCAEY